MLFFFNSKFEVLLIKDWALSVAAKMFEGAAKQKMK